MAADKIERQRLMGYTKSELVEELIVVYNQCSKLSEIIEKMRQEVSDGSGI